jgi:histidine decarboxylase
MKSNTLTLDKQEIQKLERHFTQERGKCFGLQINQSTSDCLRFASLLKHTLNNLGDPFDGFGGQIHTLGYERELILLMADYLRISHDDIWGYTTSGSTISNIQAVHLANLKLNNQGILLTSNQAHSSIRKSVSLLRVKEMVEIEADLYGKMDLDKFSDYLSKNREKSFIFCFASGTVSKGAYDDVRELIKIIHEHKIPRERYHIHLDAALGGLITPFVDAEEIKLDFSIPEIDSISVSFHKRLGVPFPSSVFLIRKNNLKTVQYSFVSDYNSLDTTIPGSRDGLSPFIVLTKLKSIGYDNMVLRTKKILSKASFLNKQLEAKGIPTVFNQYAPCVYFKAPHQRIIDEYHLPKYHHANGDVYTHAFTMEHISKPNIVDFVEKCAASM